MTTEIEQTRDRLLAKLTRETRKLVAYDDYFEGVQPLRFVVPELAEELGDRFMSVVLNWPRLAVEAFENRLDIEGFRYPGEDVADETLWDIWLDNDGEYISQQAHQESLALGRSYMIVGPGDDQEVPLITAESAFDCMHEDDPRTHDVMNGVKRWTDPDGTRWVTLYEPDGRTTWFRSPKKAEWTIESDSTEATDFNLPAIVPLINQPRMLGRASPRRFNHRLGRADQRFGRSEFHDVMPLADAANKIATDMMTTAEFYVAPRRWATGLDEKDFVDEDGKPIDAWRRDMDAMWATVSEKAKFGEFEQADLKNFHETLKLLVGFVQYQLALPTDFDPFTGDNPASADAIRAGEARMVKRVERKHTVLGNRQERVQRLVLLTRGDAEAAAKARRIETLWRNPATPTDAQVTDAVVKQLQVKDGQGHSLTYVEQAREKLGFSAEERKRLAEIDAEADRDPYLDPKTDPSADDSAAA